MTASLRVLSGETIVVRNSATGIPMRIRVVRLRRRRLLPAEWRRLVVATARSLEPEAA